MKISGIDEDFIDLIEYLDSKGFCPYASCDGVLAHHDDNNKPVKAYIAFLKSERIIDLMAALLKDKRFFSVGISNNTSIHPYELYGNMIQGNNYVVNFKNLHGEVTHYFDRIVRGIIDEEILVPEEEMEKLTTLNELLDKTEDSEICFRIELNTEYQPYTNKKGKTNCLEILTKDGLGYNRDMQELAKRISEKFGVVIKKHQFDENFEHVDEFIVSGAYSYLEYNFQDDDLEKVMKIIEFAMGEEKSLETLEIKEPDYDECNI